MYADKIKTKAIVSVTDSFNIISLKKLTFTYPKQITIDEPKGMDRKLNYHYAVMIHKSDNLPLAITFQDDEIKKEIEMLIKKDRVSIDLPIKLIG